ncbi:mitochondrial carrier domain-containing protein [Pseudoneurospora amorphoporcata]|uniref:Mitochondrial glycine transporter n=1 Tax=Pseudoneurospora amorphoporcata TaxID=241081 RepID=A0AAN6NX24_9PEZI|nr:mitochondrial carrier domain-containing protein [Pseudoneurospora amorphoporcata]
MSDASRKKGTKSTFHFVAGLGSGVLSAILLQPIDLLKTRVQQSGKHSLRAALAELRSSPQGLLPSLWRGTLPSALRTGFGSAIYFTTLNGIRENAARHLPSLAAATAVAPTIAAASGIVTPKTNTNQTSSSLPKLSNTGNLLAGAVARSFAGFILMPLTVLKVRYESSFYKYTSLAGAARDIARTEGPRGFFAGFGATAIRDAPYAGFYVLFYEQSKRYLSNLFPQPQLSTTPGQEGRMTQYRAASINFASGVFSAVICSIISNPFDAVKTRIQLQPKKYRNMVQASGKLLGEEGVRSLMDGLALRMSRKAMSSALAWTVYEELIRRAEGAWRKGGPEEVRL